jgi:hypothetical protein
MPDNAPALGAGAGRSACSAPTAGGGSQFRPDVTWVPWIASGGDWARAWTPDGTTLPAGVETRLSSFYSHRVAVGCSADAYAEIARLEEHEPSQHAPARVAMKLRFLTDTHRSSLRC